MSSFFIRDKKIISNSKPGKIKRKGRIYPTKSENIKRKRENIEQLNDEEISSEEDDVYINKKHDFVESDEDDQLTAQEKKVKLAKQYLLDIEKEEKERLETEELDNEVILGRLHDEVLSQAGKLRKKVADTINTKYKSDDYVVLKCKEHKLPITCLTVSTNNYLYTGSKDCTIVKWCLTSMKKVGYIPARHKFKQNENLHATPVMCLAVSPDNKHLASGDDSNIIQIWNPETLAHIFSFKGHRAAVTGLAFCRFTKHLYSSSKDRTVKVWSVEENAYLETLFGHHMAITSVDALSKGRAVTSGGTDNTVRVWKIQEESQLIYNHSRSIDGVKRLDDHHFLSYGDDGSVCIWAVTKKKPLHVISKAHGLDLSCKEPRWICSISCISNSEVFASGSCDGFIKLWKCNDNFRGASLVADVPIVGFVNALAFTSNGEKLVVGVGQEHRFGRWSRIKEAKNCIVIVHVKKSDF